MDSKKHDIIYTAADIQRYLAGGMEPAEMHALEKATLDDAFLAEAIEGYESMKDQEWESQLAALKKDFAKAHEARLIPMLSKRSGTTWKAAAAVLFIAAGVALTYYLSRPGQTENIAKISPEKTIDNSTLADSTRVATNPDAELESKSLDSNATRKPTPVITQEKRPGSGLPVRPVESRQAALDKEEDSGSVNDSLGKITFQQGEAALASRATEPELQEAKPGNMARAMPKNADRYSMAAPAGTAIFEGRVVTADGSPLRFARISTPGRETGNYADAKGKFRLLSADSVLPVEIRSVGFVTRNTQLKAGNMETIILQAEHNPPLGEAIVDGGPAAANAAYRKKKVIATPEPVINAEPEDGWTNYETYIKNNLNIPPSVLRNKIHGEVEISFEVNSAGAIINMKVDKSLCADCDTEAMRVVREGPRWKLKKGNRGTATLKLKF